MFNLLHQQLTMNPEYFIPIAFWASFTALLSLFLDKCFQEGNIFEGWLDFWAKKWLNENDPGILLEYYGVTNEQVHLKTAGKYDTVREYLFDNVKWFWFKPIGYCVICMNVWISFLFIPLVNVNFISIFFYVLFSNFIVRVTKERLI